MTDLIPEKPDLNLEISVENVYRLVYNDLDDQTHKDLLYKIYDKLTDLETKKQELKGKLQQKNDELDGWRSGELNFLSNQFVAGERDAIIDTFFIMTREKNTSADHVAQARDRLKKQIDIHKNAAEALAHFMDDMLTMLSERLIPDPEYMYIDMGNLSKQEKRKMERVLHSDSKERIKISRKALHCAPADLHLEGNQILIDPKQIDPRQREAASKAFAMQEGSNSSIVLPARALVQKGDIVDEDSIQTLQEENPDQSVEEADPNMYGEGDETPNEGEANDGLPFD